MTEISSEVRVVAETLDFYVRSRYPEISSFVTRDQIIDISVTIIKAMQDAKILPAIADTIP